MKKKRTITISADNISVTSNHDGTLEVDLEMSENDFMSVLDNYNVPEVVSHIGVYSIFDCINTNAITDYLFDIGFTTRKVDNDN